MSLDGAGDQVHVTINDDVAGRAGEIPAAARPGQQRAEREWRC